MANIELNSERGFSLIEEKLINLTSDIETMVEKKEISDEAAKWLLTEFKIMANICRDYMPLEDENNNFHTIKF